MNELSVFDMNMSFEIGFMLSKFAIVSIIIAVVLIIGIVILGIWGKKLQKQQDESRQQLEAAKQSVKLLVIDKKRMKLKDANMPAIVMEQVPKRMQGQKLPIVKAKVGPQIMSFICEERIFDLVPVKKEVRAEISGIYIMGVKGIKTSLEKKGKKLSFREKVANKAQEISSDITSGKKDKKDNAPTTNTKSKKGKK